VKFSCSIEFLLCQVDFNKIHTLAFGLRPAIFSSDSES
jgi:hypothetical protein